MTPRLLFFSCVEPSADLHASHVVRAVEGLAPGVRVKAAGGVFLARAGAEVIIDMRGQAVMGLVEVVRHLGFFRQAIRRTLAWVARNRPDAVVLVDAPGYHMRLGLALRRRFPRLPILYFIAPKAWAWQPGRARTLARFVTRLLCIFPFEEEWFGARGLPALYVGNPTLDELRPIIARREARLAAARSSPGDETRVMGAWPADGLRTVAVFPGSRAAEVRRLWPVFAPALAELRNRLGPLAFSVALAPGVEPTALRALAPIPERTAFVAPGESQAMLSQASFAMAKSGTTTLEAALLGVPMVVAYRMHPITALLARFLVGRHLGWFSLPNILAGRSVVPELFQSEVTAENLRRESEAILGDSARYRRMQRDLVALRGGFGDKPAGERAAEAILSLAGSG